jgi:hypothetical protein
MRTTSARGGSRRLPVEPGERGAPKEARDAPAPVCGCAGLTSPCPAPTRGAAVAGRTGEPGVVCWRAGVRNANVPTDNGRGSVPAVPAVCGRDGVGGIAKR